MPSGDATATSRSVLFDFNDPAGLDDWFAVNDAVMGGVSTGRMTLHAPGVACFSGVVSLGNGGGFASVRTSPRHHATDGASALRLRVQGDGRDYKFTARTDDGFDGVQYQARFTTAAGAWQDVRLSGADFVPTFRGRPVPGAPPIDFAQLRAIGFTIADRQAGPFALLVGRIEAETG